MAIATGMIAVCYFVAVRAVIDMTTQRWGTAADNSPQHPPMAIKHFITVLATVVGSVLLKDVSQRYHGAWSPRLGKLAMTRPILSAAESSLLRVRWV